MSTYRLDPVQQRVLGCLVEKQRTTPDQYPLSLNALRLACNQSTNRDPVMSVDEERVHAAAQELGRLGLTRLASGRGSRAVKYRHLLDEALALTPGETAVLAVLLLRGPQTSAELNARTERLHRFAGAAEVTATLEALDTRELARLLPRQPGQREERWTHLLGEGPRAADDDAPDTLERRLARVEEKLAELEHALAERGVLDS
jgi:uncharacterized protein